jgi:hypothetical protein
MRIGFASIFPWRPHVEHLHYLSLLAREAGHEVCFLSCDADLPHCYHRELRPDRPGVAQCAACRLGGLRTFESRGVRSIGDLADAGLEPVRPTAWGLSSAATIGRFEAPAEFASPECSAIATRLDQGARRAYSAARRWIEGDRLDALCLFNGRIDATRGLLEAAQDAAVPFVSVERTWFSDGLQLLPNENCLGLKSVDSMVRRWRDVPLTEEQARRAASHVASRFLRRNGMEWRAYNTQARVEPWPVSGRRRVLFVPSSRNEVWGDPDWSLRWTDQTVGFDRLMARLGLEPRDVVVRAHPNWAERIGLRDGSRPDAMFSSWAAMRGLHYIPPAERTSTLGLIEQADAVVVCGGSAALEAGALGKQIISLGPAAYQQAGFTTPAEDEPALSLVELHADLPLHHQADLRREIARRTLRFCYTMVYRVAQYVPFVRAVTTLRYEYLEGADPARLVGLLRGGPLTADDPTEASDLGGENAVLDLVSSRRWTELIDTGLHRPHGRRVDVGRRFPFQPIDWVRERLPRGDL